MGNIARKIAYNTPKPKSVFVGIGGLYNFRILAKVIWRRVEVSKKQFVERV